MEKNRAAERAEKRWYWEEKLKGWKQSGQTRANYCRERNLAVHQFWYWRKRLCPEKTAATLVELPMRARMPGPSSAISLIVDGGCRIEIREGFNPSMLEQVLRIICRL